MEGNVYLSSNLATFQFSYNEVAMLYAYDSLFSAKN